MKLKSLFIVFLLLGSMLSVHAQEGNIKVGESIQLDTTSTVKADKKQKKADKIKLKKPRKFYDPKVASRRSALIPGWGQIYNDSWWKVPILYGGLGLSIYFIDFNNRQRIGFENRVRELVDMQNMGVAINQNELRINRRQADEWRKNRDLLYIVTLGVYALNIVEAAIDAHLKGFDVDENLGLNLKPKLGVINSGAPYLGFGITLPIGK